ncbi:MAG: signal peptidase I [Halolamina sp.]
MTGRTRLRRALNVVGSVVLLVALVVTVVVAFPSIVGADHSYVVLSGSMQPTIEAGDVVVVAETPPDRIESGDVMAFDRTEGDDKRTTHRVIEVVERDGERYFRTKGDANEEPDTHLVPADAVIGTIQFTIPEVGRLFSFAKSDVGVLAFVAVPGFLLVASELWTLVAAARTDGADAENLGENP